MQRYYIFLTYARALGVMLVKKLKMKYQNNKIKN